MKILERKNIYLANAFSLSMVPYEDATLHIQKVSSQFVASMIKTHGFTSAVGHQSTAQVLSEILGVNVATNRVPIAIGYGDILFVAQLGVRLEEGKVLTKEEIQELIKEDKLVFYQVQVI